MFSIGGGDLFDPIAFLVSKLLSKFGQEIYRTFSATPISEWALKEWLYLTFLVTTPAVVIAAIVYVKKRNTIKPIK